MDLDIKKMVGKAYCYADNHLADNLSKWYVLRKAYADGYKEAVNQERAKADSSKENIRCVSDSALPLKIERIIAVVAQRWGSEYGGSTVGILGQDAIELCEQYGIDWKNYR